MLWIRRLLTIGGVLFAGLVLVYLLGPKPDFPALRAELPMVEVPLPTLPDMLARREAKVNNLRPDNHARILWADSIRQTPVSIVYLHGFTASPLESEAVVVPLARQIGANLYLPRLADHGIDSRESFADCQPQDWIDSAAEALVIGKRLGKKVIVVSCSTGSTLGAYLSARFPEYVDAHIMYSPNFAIENSTAKLLNGPWGLELARRTTGSDYRSFELPEGAEQYWTAEYRLEGLVCLQELLEQTMTDEVFTAIDQPWFAGFYYKNEEERDMVISVPAIRERLAQTATPTHLRELRPFANVDTHVIGSHFQSKDIGAVQMATEQFVQRLLREWGIAS